MLFTKAISNILDKKSTKEKGKDSADRDSPGLCISCFSIRVSFPLNSAIGILTPARERIFIGEFIKRCAGFKGGFISFYGSAGPLSRRYSFAVRSFGHHKYIEPCHSERRLRIYTYIYIYIYSVRLEVASQKISISLALAALKLAS